MAETIRFVYTTVRVCAGAMAAAVEALSSAGLLTSTEPRWGDTPEGWLHLVATLEYEGESQDAPREHEFVNLVWSTLQAAGVEFQVAVSGGVGSREVGQRWLDVIDVATLEPIGARVLAADEAGVDKQLEQLAAALGVSRDGLTVRPVSGWNRY